MVEKFASLEKVKWNKDSSKIYEVCLRSVKSIRAANKPIKQTSVVELLYVIKKNL